MKSKSEAEQVKTPFRILVVDDSDPFRRFTTSTINNFPGFHVIGEAKDGLEAVQKVEALEPDLVVLDIGIPRLNGIETARKIHSVSDCKIFFLTGNPFPEVMREALSAGANGYVVKVDASEELHEALLAVLQGKRYISKTLAGRF